MNAGSKEKRKEIILLTSKLLGGDNRTQRQRLRVLVKHFDVTCYLNYPGSVAVPGIKGMHVCPGGRFYLNLVLYPLWVLYRVLVHHKKKNRAAIYTNFFPLCIVTGFLLKHVLGARLIVDLFDDPALFYQMADSYGSLFEAMKKLYFRALNRLVELFMPAADYIVVSLVPDILRFYGVDPGAGNVLALTNAMDPSLLVPAKEQPAGRGGFSVAYVGDIKMIRGMDIIAGAAAVLHSKGYDITFDIVGGGTREDYEIFQSAIKAGDMDAGFRHHGPLPHDEALKVLAGADVCLCILTPDIRNYNYCYPIKIFEYMGLGKAIVATDLKGIASIIGHEESGLLVKPSDARALSAAIERLYNDRALMHRLSNRAFQDSSMYVWDKVNSVYERGVLGFINSHR